jgi:hypothetical protein
LIDLIFTPLPHFWAIFLMIELIRPRLSSVRFVAENFWIFSYTVSSLVTDILPALNFPNSQLKDATVEDILSHRTGLAGALKVDELEDSPER